MIKGYAGENMPLPNRPTKFYEVISVYAVGAAILYTWALINTMNDFSKNWVLYLTASEVMVEFAYVLMGVFFESLLVGAILFLGRFLLPQKILAGRFVAYGSLIIAAFLGWLIFRDGLVIGLGGAYAELWRNVIVGAALILALLGERFKIIHRGIEAIADRCVILLYIYLPLSLVSLVVVVIRNIE